MKPIIKKYANEEVTVVWQPHLCMHSENCFHGLPDVFNPNQRPWIKVDAAQSEQIRKQVGKCPSGALSILADEIKEGQNEGTSLELMKNGPILISGNIQLKDGKGNIQDLKNKTTAFCRCGGSSNKPYCDGSHKNNGFVG